MHERVDGRLVGARRIELGTEEAQVRHDRILLVDVEQVEDVVDLARRDVRAGRRGGRADVAEDGQNVEKLDRRRQRRRLDDLDAVPKIVEGRASVSRVVDAMAKDGLRPRREQLLRLDDVALGVEVPRAAVVLVDEVQRFEVGVGAEVLVAVFERVCDKGG